MPERGGGRRAGGCWSGRLGHRNRSGCQIVEHGRTPPDKIPATPCGSISYPDPKRLSSEMRDGPQDHTFGHCKSSTLSTLPAF
jgi:hypothetical protein